MILWLRLALAAVFVIAGVAKLANLTGTRRAVADFGAPRILVGIITVLLPLAELTTATILLVPTIAGAILGLALLAMFSIAIAINLARGRRPDCHCFGQSSPIGAGTLVRNAVFAVPAIVIVASDDLGPSALRWEVIASAVAASILWLGTRFATDLLRQHGRLLLRIDRLEAALVASGIELPDEPRPHVGIPLGDPAPPFTSTALDGTARTLVELIAEGRPILLVFTDPDCAMCVALRPKLAAWARDHARALTIVTLHDPTGAISRAYHSRGTPSALLISPSGTIASSHAQGATEIEGLVSRAIAGDLAPPPGPRIGTVLPELVLADLEGAAVPLATQLDAKTDTLVVFWDPSCGFCRAMRDELRALSGTRAMIIVSSGDTTAVRAEGFHSPTLLDPELRAAAKLDIAGTPMGLLVGPDATVRSELMVGAEGIFALATHPARAV